MGALTVKFCGCLSMPKDTDTGNYKDGILYLLPDHANPALVWWLVRNLWRVVTFRATSVLLSI